MHLLTRKPITQVNETKIIKMICHMQVYKETLKARCLSVIKYVVDKIES